LRSGLSLGGGRRLVFGFFLLVVFTSFLGGSLLSVSLCGRGPSQTSTESSKHRLLSRFFLLRLLYCLGLVLDLGGWFLLWGFGGNSLCSIVEERDDQQRGMRTEMKWKSEPEIS
jgi:hypothetical protein